MTERYCSNCGVRQEADGRLNHMPWCGYLAAERRNTAAGTLTDYQRGYSDGFDAPANVKARLVEALARDVDASRARRDDFDEALARLREAL